MNHLLILISFVFQQAMFIPKVKQCARVLCRISHRSLALHGYSVVVNRISQSRQKVAANIGRTALKNQYG